MVRPETVEPNPNTDGGKFFLGKVKARWRIDHAAERAAPPSRSSDPETEGRLVEGEDVVSDVGSRHQRPASRNEVHDQ